MTQHTVQSPFRPLGALQRLTLNRQLSARQSQRGVTLVEVLIVVAIMAMLAGGVAFAILPKMQETRIKTARQGATELRKMAELWRAETGEPCPTVSQLKKDKYLDKAAGSEDPWGTTYEIKCDGDDVVVRSPGPDKQEGTKDDIQVPAASSDDDEG
jgi:general secretion pathway protein G